jgi:hypothetical protein
MGDTKYRLRFLFGLLALLFIGGCNQQTLDSTWRIAKFGGESIDSTWAYSSVYFLEDNNLSIGLANDNDALSIMLKSADRQTQAKIMRGGLIVWLDTGGKKNKIFGVHYPVGMQSRIEPRGEHAAERKEPPNADDRGDFQRWSFTLPDTMEIIGPQKDEKKMFPITNDRGVEIATSTERGTITYRLVIPLMALTDSSYYLNIAGGKLVGVGFETGEFKAPENFGRRGGYSGGEPGEGPDGGFGGGFGGRGGMRGGDREGGRNFDPISYWAKINLAGEPGK